MPGTNASPESANPSRHNQPANPHQRAATELAGVSPEEMFGPEENELFDHFLAYANDRKFPYSKEFNFSDRNDGNEFIRKGYVLGKYGNPDKVGSDDRILVMCDDGRLRATSAATVRSKRSIYTERQRGILPHPLRSRALGALALGKTRSSGKESAWNANEAFHPGFITEEEHKVSFKAVELEDVLKGSVGYDFRPIDLSAILSGEHTDPHAASVGVETPSHAALHQERAAEAAQDSALRAEEREIRRAELEQRKQILRLRGAQLALGIIPTDSPRGAERTQGKPNPDRALQRYQENIALIERYQSNPTYQDTFDEDRLKALHQEIQDEAWPLYEARLAELNAGKSDKDKIESVEKMPADERRKIVDPIDASRTASYLSRYGHANSAEMRRALTLARLKAVGKLKKPTKA